MYVPLSLKEVALYLRYDEKGIFLITLNSFGPLKYFPKAMSVALIRGSGKILGIISFKSFFVRLITLTTSILPSVIVPVLSKHKTSTHDKVSIPFSF